MTCTVFEQVAHEYFLERLPASEVQRMDEHVSVCADCADFMAICRELSCKEFVDFLNDYIDDLLCPTRRAVFERHLEICQDCRHYLASYRQVTELSVLALGGSGRGLDLGMDLPVPEGLVRAIVSALREPAADGANRGVRTSRRG